MYKVSAAVLPEYIEIKTSEPQTGVTGTLNVDGDEDRDGDGDEIAMSSGPYNLAVTTSETTPAATESHVGAIGGFGMGEQYIDTQMLVADPFFERPNQTMGAMSALANDDQGFETSITSSTGEFLADTLDLTVEHVPMDHESTLEMISLVRGNPATRSPSLIRLDTPLNAAFNQELENWWSSNMRSPSFDENLETQGKRILL